MNRTPNDPGHDELDLLRRLRQLPRERDPQRDLWTGIEARLAPATRPAARPARWLGLALAAGIAALAVLATRAGMDAPAPSAPLAAAPADAPPAPPLPREADALTLEYRLALETFESAPLPPALQAAAVELDASAEQLRLALREQPQAPYLLDRLRQTYDQRLKLTQRGALG
jgi:hypothetical protein